MSDTGRLGQAPWGAVLGRPGGEDGSAGPVPGLVDVTAPITGDGSAGTPVGISAATTAAAGSMSAADKLKLDNLPGTIAASWPVGSFRFYALDPVGGSDANAGFSDVSMAAAGLVAVQTLAKLLSIIPAIGNGRLLYVAVKTGTVPGDGVINFPGYARQIWRSTSDFSNNATDKVRCAFATALAGPNVDGSFTVNAAPAPTANTFTVAAGALTAEPGILGCRVRFVTGALAGQVRQVQANTASALTVLDDFTGAPVAGDTFLLEEPGVVFSGVITVGGSNPQGQNIAAGGGGLTMVGFNFTGADVVVSSELNPSFSFCKGTSFFVYRFNTVALDITYRDEALASITTGVGFFCTGNLDIEFGMNATVVAAVRVGLLSLRGVAWFKVNGFLGSGSSEVTSAGFGPSPNIDRAFGASLGPIPAGSRRNLRIKGMILEASEVEIANVTIEAGTFTIRSGCTINMDGVGGTTAAAAALTLTGSNSRCLFGTQIANTFTGASEDILLPNAVAVARADLLLTNVCDENGNELVGTAGMVAPRGAFRRVTNKSGGALAPGVVVRGNGTTRQVTLATGNSATIGDSSMLGVMVTSPANNGDGLMTFGPYAYVLFDGAPTPGAIAYLSPGTPGDMTTTVPAVAANNNRLRCGRVVSVPAGSTGIVALSPENLAIVATGAP